jgi:hypothetical protein
MRVTKKQCKIIKRVLLLLVLLPFIAVIPYNQLAWSRNLYFIVPASGVGTYIILLNFPSLVKAVHSRPLYYDDLEDIRFVDYSVRRRYQFVFILILQITFTIIISGLIYYYYNRFHLTTLSNVEMFGVFGGCISLLLKIENNIGTAVLNIINLVKNKSKKDISNHDENIMRIRSTSLEIVINS